jgi:hypothetical protein
MAEEMFGDSDPTMDDAAMKIMALGPQAMGLKPLDEVRRENAETRDPTQRETSTDLEEAEGQEKVNAADEKPEAKVAGEDEKAEAGDFIEIPGSAEGEEAERVPVAEALELIKQAREFKGDVAAAIVKVETEAQSKMDAVMAEIAKAHDYVFTQAEMALQALPIPAKPHQALIDPNSQYYDPQAYHAQMVAYDQQMQAIGQAQATAKAAKEHSDKTNKVIQTEKEAREHAKLARYWPEWSKPEGQQKLQAELLAGLDKHFGLKPADVDGIIDHRLLLMAKAAIDAKEAPAKAKAAAPAIKQEVQQRVARVVKSGAAPARGEGGKFVSDAYKSLEKTGSEDDAARYFMRSGLAKF